MCNYVHNTFQFVLSEKSFRHLFFRCAHKFWQLKKLNAYKQDAISFTLTKKKYNKKNSQLTKKLTVER